VRGGRPKNARKYKETGQFEVKGGVITANMAFIHHHKQLYKDEHMKQRTYYKNKVVYHAITSWLTWL
jgi:hypothetical protein